MSEIELPEVGSRWVKSSTKQRGTVARRTRVVRDGRERFSVTIQYDDGEKETYEFFRRYHEPLSEPPRGHKGRRR